MGRWHAHAIDRVGGRVVAVIDQDVARARALAERLPGRPAAAPDLGRAILEHDVEVLHVCTPVASHETLARQAIEAGVPVLVEKPVAPDAAAVERLHALAETREVLLCPVFQFLFQPGVLEAERAIGRLGAVRHLDVMVCSAGAEHGSDADRESVALDILPHGMALARRLLGEPLSGADWRIAGGAPGEIRALADAAGAAVGIGVSMHARPTENSLTVRCDRGTIRVNLFHGYATIGRGAPTRLDKIGRPIIESTSTLGAAIGNLAARLARREVAYPGLRELVRRFHRACASGEASPVSVEESIDVARACDSIRAARSVARR